jgi:hypothetical protein
MLPHPTPTKDIAVVQECSENSVDVFQSHVCPDFGSEQTDLPARLHSPVPQ